MAELVDAGDLKSPARRSVRVRVPPPAYALRVPGGGEFRVESAEQAPRASRAICNTFLAKDSEAKLATAPA